MPTLPPGTEVAIRTDTLRRLSFPPPPKAVLLIAVHPASLKAPQSSHTQLAGFEYGDLVWAGALSEGRMEVLSQGGGDPRQLLGEAVGVGDRLWEVIWPGELMADPRPGPFTTVYQGERPWVVLGEASNGDLLAAPLNEAANPKWYTPVVRREEILIHHSTKDAQLELAHLWSLPASTATAGRLAPEARARVLEAVKTYF